MEPTVEVCFFTDTQASDYQNLRKFIMSTKKQNFPYSSQIIIYAGWSILHVHCVDSFVKLLLSIVFECLFDLSSIIFLQSEIFKALEKTRLLVGDKKESQYSRCGRTDKGVSSVGQVSWCRKGGRKEKKMLSVCDEWYITWLKMMIRQIGLSISVIPLTIFAAEDLWQMHYKTGWGTYGLCCWRLLLLESSFIFISFFVWNNETLKTMTVFSCNPS